MEKKLAPLGITYQEFRIAGLLMGDNDITQKDLANKLNVRAATLSIAISKLAERGLVRRVPSTTDKRVNYLQLVPGEKIESISQILLTLEQSISRGISDSELETAGEVLSKLIENLNK
ncbi:MAG: DNA-binding MarR family transcriptional regulator [Candidatus Azotimanducaceae bacterium]|jgi:DNA-binding MarR family transcriptional regulator